MSEHTEDQPAGRGEDTVEAAAPASIDAVTESAAEETAEASAFHTGETAADNAADNAADESRAAVAEESGGTSAADIPAAENASGEGARPSSRRSRTRADLEKEGEVAADFLETLLDVCDLDGDLDVDIDGDRAAVSIVDSEEGRVPRRLVGSNGQVLEALQELTRLAVQSATGERSRLMLDVAGHRAERKAALVTLAKGAIAEVKDSGERKALEPMTAFERKVVHDEVLAAGLVSESEGSEPRRYVVVLPAN
jgi:spoIIIJ-associated protein